MAANGISTSLPKSNRANLKLALSQTIRSTLPPTVSDASVVWTVQIYDPASFSPPQTVGFWYPLTFYALNSYIDVNGVFYKATTAGTTGATQPIWTHPATDDTLGTVNQVGPFGYRPLNTVDPADVNPPRPTPLEPGRPWD